MSRINLEIAGKHEQLAMNTVVQLPGVLTSPPRQIRAPNRSNEQRIARQHEPRLRPSPQIGNHQTNAFRCVAGRMQHPDPRIAELELLLVTKRLEREVHVRGLVQAITRSRLFREG